VALTRFDAVGVDEAPTGGQEISTLPSGIALVDGTLVAVIALGSGWAHMRRINLARLNGIRGAVRQPVTVHEFWIPAVYVANDIQFMVAADGATPPHQDEQAGEGRYLTHSPSRHTYPAGHSGTQIWHSFGCWPLGSAPPVVPQSYQPLLPSQPQWGLSSAQSMQYNLPASQYNVLPWSSQQPV
jgi:hypothetical protein